MDEPSRLFRPWNFPGKNTGVGCHFLLQGIFPTLASNLSLLHCRQILYQLSHQGNPSSQKLPLKTLPHLFLPRLTPLFSCLCHNQMHPRPRRMSLDLPGKNMGVGCNFLLQGIFPTQGSNPHLLCLPPWRAGRFFTTLPLSHLRSYEFRKTQWKGCVSLPSRLHAPYWEKMGTVRLGHRCQDSSLPRGSL